MILLLFGSFKCLLRANNDTIPLRAGYYEAIAEVPISLIKQANIKLIERKYLLEINKEQDSIINLKNKYIVQQDSIINKFQEKINITNNINNELKTKINKYNKFAYIGGIAISCCIILLICK